MPLTLEMYQQARRLEELAVLDLAGYPMPFYRVNESPPTPASVALRFRHRPCMRRTRRRGAHDPTDEQRTNVTVTRPPDQADAQIAAFILDARAVEPAPLALELKWRALAQPLLMEVRIEQSQTLTEWRPVGRASIAQLSIDDMELRHGRVPVVATQGGYYRITASGSVVDWYLESAELVSAAAERPPTRVARFAPTAERPTETARRTKPPRPRLVFRPRRAFAGDNRGGWFHRAESLGPRKPRVERFARWAVAHPCRQPPVLRARLRERELGERGCRGRPSRASLLARRVRYRTVAGRRGAASRVPEEHLRFYAEGIAPYMLVAGTVSPAADRTLRYVPFGKSCGRAGRACSKLRSAPWSSSAAPRRWRSRSNSRGSRQPFGSCWAPVCLESLRWHSSSRARCGKTHRGSRLARSKKPPRFSFSASLRGCSRSCCCCGSRSRLPSCSRCGG